MNSINGIAEKYMNNGNDSDQTIASEIKANLQQIASQKDKKTYVENEKDPVSTYHLGNESATIYKRLTDGTVGESNGTMTYYAEYSDLKRLSWWKTALDGLSISFLETPIEDFVKTSHISNLELIFSPEAVISHYHLNPTSNEDIQIAAKQWVQDQIIKVLTPLVGRDFKVKFYEKHFRLIPLTPSAKESREIDNETYEKAKKAIESSVDLLKEIYKKMSESKKTNQL